MAARPLSAPSAQLPRAPDHERVRRTTSGQLHPQKPAHNFLETRFSNLASKPWCRIIARWPPDLQREALRGLVKILRVTPMFRGRFSKGFAVFCWRLKNKWFWLISWTSEGTTEDSIRLSLTSGCFEPVISSRDRYQHIDSPTNVSVTVAVLLASCCGVKVH